MLPRNRNIEGSDCIMDTGISEVRKVCSDCPSENMDIIEI